MSADSHEIKNPTNSHIGQQHRHIQSTLILLQRRAHLGNVLIRKNKPPRLLQLRQRTPLFKIHKLLQQRLQLRKVLRGLRDDPRQLRNRAVGEWLVRLEVLVETVGERAEDLADA